MKMYTERKQEQKQKMKLSLMYEKNIAEAITTENNKINDASQQDTFAYLSKPIKNTTKRVEKGSVKDRKNQVTY